MECAVEVLVNGVTALVRGVYSTGTSTWSVQYRHYCVECAVQALVRRVCSTGTSAWSVQYRHYSAWRVQYRH